MKRNFKQVKEQVEILDFAHFLMRRGRLGDANKFPKSNTSTRMNPEQEGSKT